MNKHDPPIEIVTQSHEGRDHLAIRHKSNKPSVAILVEKDSKFLLLNITRHLLGPEPHLEIPRGFGELATPIEDAHRELFEETNLSVQSLIQIGNMNADSGVIANTTIFFWATAIEDNFRPNQVEGISGRQWLTHQEISSLISTGEITDGYTIAAIKFYELFQNSRNKTSDTELTVPLRDFFLNDTMENMRATESKQLQLAIGTVGAFAIVISTFIEKANSAEILDLSPKNLGATIGLTVWSTAATTKLFRYRAWKEYYGMKIRELTGPHYTNSVPIIYSPIKDSGRTAKVQIKKRLFGDESLVSICLLLNLLSAFFLSIVLWQETFESNLPSPLKTIISLAIIGSLSFLIFRLKKSAFFQISEEDNS